MRIDGLDAVRGLAIAFVLARHAFPNQLGGAGIVGVVMFFTLSGYLISGLIVTDIERFGTVRWARFYAHRAFRLLPALLAMLAVFSLVTLIWDPRGEAASLPKSLLYSIFYLSDLPFTTDIATSLGHLWTLAVEEQFYLVWPVALYAVVRLRWRIVWFAAGAAVVLVLVSSASTLAADDPSNLYRLPTSWAAAMALGGLARFQRGALLRFSARHRMPLGVATLVCLLLLALVPNAKDQAVTYMVGAALVAALTVGLIGVAEHSPTLPRPPATWLVWLGTVSYAAYLWNYPVVTILDVVDASQTVQTLLHVATIPVTLALAWVSWITVEAWGRSARARFDARAREREVKETSAATV